MVFLPMIIEAIKKAQLKHRRKHHGGVAGCNRWKAEKKALADKKKLNHANEKAPTRKPIARATSIARRN